MRDIRLFCCVLLLLISGCRNRCEELRELYTAQAAEVPLNGVIAILQNGELCTLSARINTLPEVTMDESLHIASLSKLFTQVAVFRLIDQGIIQPDSTLLSYRPRFQPQFGHRVTVRQLLNMSAGVPREYEPADLFDALEFDQDGKAGSALDQMPDPGLLFEPGAQREYSNLGYWLLGAVVEAVTDTTLGGALNALIFAPLDMAHSGFGNSQIEPVPGFEPAGEGWRLVQKRWEGRYASGGFYSSIEDMLKLARALHHGEFLSPESIEMLSDGSGQRLEIYGALPGYTNFLLIDFDADLTAVAMHNHTIGKKQVLVEMVEAIKQAAGIADKSGNEAPKITLRKMAELDLQHPLERALHSWVEAIEAGHRITAYNHLTSQAMPGKFEPDDPTWAELENLARSWSDFRAAGFRWVRQGSPHGLEVWFVNDGPEKLGVLWIPSEIDTTRVSDILIKPDDMVWMGQEF